MARIIADNSLLKRASVSSLSIGLWGIVVFIMLGPESLRILDVLTSLGYPRTNPATFLYYALAHIFLVVIMIPVSVFFACCSWKVGVRLKARLLGFTGLCWLALTGVSIVLIPSVYQDALTLIAVYEVAIAQGILPEFFFNPLSLPTIHQWIYMLISVTALVFTVGAAEMTVRSHRSGFALCSAIALISAILLTIVPALTLALLIYPFSTIVFGLEQRLMASQVTKEEQLSGLSHI